MRRIPIPAALALLPVLLATPLVDAQWRLEDSGTVADLRGIDNVGEGIAWASGSNGTVLRTLDMGKTWGHCTTPPNAEKLDFRGIQAFDKDTALVMSSGKGDLSRLYKTTDGCKTWKLVFMNPDQEGFWDTLQMTNSANGWLFGDPVRNRFYVAETRDGGHSFVPLTVTQKNEETNESVPRDDGQRGAFAASNSALLIAPGESALPQSPGKPCTYSVLWFGTSGPAGSKLYRLYNQLPQCSDFGSRHWNTVTLPLSGERSTAGVFSLAAASSRLLVAVGGDYTEPDATLGTAAVSNDGGQHWNAATTPPHGYRSAVAYDPKTNSWMTVGPNGTDLSADDGRNWQALKPDPAANDTPDADQHWNALSLPFVVGPKGRIGLRDGTAP